MMRTSTAMLLAMFVEAGIILSQAVSIDRAVDQADRAIKLAREWKGVADGFHEVSVEWRDRSAGCEDVLASMSGSKR